MEFVDIEHELFFEKKLLFQEESKVKPYYKALVYTLGICETTRKNFDKIFDMAKGEINIDSINDPYQTSTSQKVTRMAFSLFNGCNYDSEKDIENGILSSNYNASDIFCCSYAKYFCEAIKIRFPEYFREYQNSKVIKLVESDDREKYVIYIRNNNDNEVMSQLEIEEKKKMLLELCNKNNYNVTHIYIDEGFSGKIEGRIALSKMLEEMNKGNINGIITRSMEELVREQYMNTKFLLEQIKNTGTKLMLVEYGKIVDFFKSCELSVQKVFQEQEKEYKKEKNKKRTKNRNDKSR